MKDLLAVLERWSSEKPKPLVWVVAAAACWLLLGIVLALALSLPALGGDLEPRSGQAWGQDPRPAARQQAVAAPAGAASAADEGRTACAGVSVPRMRRMV